MKSFDAPCCTWLHFCHIWVRLYSRMCLTGPRLTTFSQQSSQFLILHTQINTYIHTCLHAYMHIIKAAFSVSAFTSIRAYICSHKWSIAIKIRIPHITNSQLPTYFVFQIVKFQSDITPHRFNGWCSIGPATQINSPKAWPQVQHTHIYMYIYIHWALGRMGMLTFNRSICVWHCPSVVEYIYLGFMQMPGSVCLSWESAA